MKNMKIKNLTLPALAIALLAGCSAPGGDLPPTINNGTSAESLYAFEAVTSVGLLSQVQNQGQAMGVRRAIQVDDELVNKLNAYLPTVESALKGESLLTSAKTEASDDPMYETKQIITYTDINMTEMTIVMYYNETIIVDDDEDDDDWDDKHEQEQESFIEGTITVDGNTYKMRGEKELDDDEYEINFRYILSETSFVLVEQEIERGEQEFTYTLVENGREVYEYSLEIEDDEVSLEMEAGNSESEMKFFLANRDGKNLIGCKIEEGRDEEVVFFEKIVSPEGQVTYQLYLPVR